MKRTARIAAAVMALLLLLPSVLAPAMAAASLKYVGIRNGRFHYRPGSEYSKTDLFPNFKDVMPGDKITDTIEIYNNQPDGKNVAFYVRSLGAQEETNEFLSQMTLTVQKHGGKKLFVAQADKVGQMKGWTHIATLEAGSKAVLDLTLNVPVEMGNEFQNQVGYIDWEFKIIEDPPDDDDGDGSTVPETGDRNNLIFYGGLVVLSAAALIFLIFGKKRKKEEE